MPIQKSYRSCTLHSIYKKSLKIPKGYQNPYIEEEQTTQWPKEKEQNDKQRSTKHTHKTKDRVTEILVLIIITLFRNYTFQ
jgi:hypothetical protein